MKKRILASLLSLCLLVGLLPTAAMAVDETSDNGEPVVCTCEALCTEEAVDENCPVCAEDFALCAYKEAPVDEGEPVPCTLTEGCTLEDGHAGECVITPAALESIYDVTNDTTVIDPDQEGVLTEEEVPADPSVEEQLAELIAALPAPEEIEPLDEKQVEEVYNQIAEIYAFAEENGLDVEDNETVNAVIAALYPAEPLEETTTLTSIGDELSSGAYTVSDTLTLTQQVIINGDVTISGNGTIKRGESLTTYMIVVPKGSSLTLSGVTIDGGAIWNGGSDTTLNRGTENSGVAATAAMIYNFGTLNIEDDTVLQNNSNESTRTNDSGVPIFATVVSADNGLGGRILSYPTADEETSYGGAVLNGGTMTISGGTLQNNQAFRGAGVCSYGILRMTSGTITTNHTVAIGDVKYADGAGIYLAGGKNTGTVDEPLDWTLASVKESYCQISGGEISANVSDGNAGGVIADSYSKLYLSGNVSITKNICGREYTGAAGGGVSLYSAYGEISGGMISENVSEKSNSGGINVGASSTLKMTGGTVSKNETPNSGGGISVTSGSTAELGSGVTITQNSAKSGGGVYVANSESTLTINGAEISSNTAAQSGAGVYVYSYQGIAFVVMESGSIKENSIESKGENATNIFGGGVYITSSQSQDSSAAASFELKGGSISGNSLTLDNGSTATRHAQGAGVWVGTGSFTMSGGTIGGENSGNKITVTKSANTDTNAYGAGVFVNTTGTFTLISGQISYNTAEAKDAEASTDRNANVYGAGLYATSTKLTLTGGEISHNTANAETTKAGNAAVSGGSVYLGGQSGNVAIGVKINENTAKATSSVGTATVTGGGLYVVGTTNGNITLSGEVSGNTAEAVNSGNSNAVAQGGGVCASTVSLTLTGKVDGNNLTANHSSNNAKVSIFGGGIYSTSNTLIIEDGASISDNTLTSSGAGAGGGLAMNRSTSVTMNGGSISDNIAVTTCGTSRNGQIGGGGVEASGTFIINGGTISGNVADGYHNGGGGVRVNGTSAVVTMNGGAVSGNIACNSAEASGSTKGSGAFHVTDGGTLNIKGGAITGNAAMNGGAITFIDGPYARGTVNITGGAITGNYCTTGNGGAIFMPSASKSTSGQTFDQVVNINGSPVITGNYKGATISKDQDGKYTINTTSASPENNIYLATNNRSSGNNKVDDSYAVSQTLVLTGTLTPGASIGVTAAQPSITTPTAIAEGASDYTVTDGDAAYFYYDGGNYLVQKSSTDGENKIVLAAKVTGATYYTVTLALPEDGSVVADRATTALVKSDETYGVTFTAQDGYVIADVKIGDTSQLTSHDVKTATLSGRTFTNDTTFTVTSTPKNIVVTPTGETSNVAGTYGAELNHQLTVSTAYENEAEKDIALTYALKEGSSLPAGLTLSENGLISGTPTAAVTNSTVTVIATAATNGQTAEITLTVTIAKAVPTVSLADKSGVTYTGKPIVMDGATVTLVNGDAYNGEITYTYYTDKACANPLTGGTPTDAGTYYVKASIAERDNYKAAESDAAKLEIVNATFSVSADGYNGVYDGKAYSITVNADSDTNVTYSETTDGEYTGTKPTYTDVGTYTVYYKAVKANYEPYIGSATIVITKAEQTVAPAAPTASSRARTSITLTPVEPNANGAVAEYGIYSDGGTWTWQDSNVFDGLTASTKYTFAVRYKETDNYNASPFSTADIYTSSSSGGSSSGGSGGSSSYTVSVDSTRNGTVKANRTSASKGTTVTLTVTPKDGYELDELTVTDKNGDTVKLTRKSGTQYTFTMPASKVTVEASFVAIEAEPDEGLPFVDVAESAYYYDAVAWAVENDITGGTSATTFSPNQTCTRAQAVTFLWRSAGSPAPKTTSNPFTDVSTSAYYYDAVLWAVENGITAGTSATTFGPNNTCTRGQIVTFMYRADGSPVSSGSSFADVSADAYYAGAVAWAVTEGITSGTSATTFGPGQSCTRAQIVTFLYRAEA